MSDSAPESRLERRLLILAPVGRDGELIEKAVGVDTTARLQTVWQVKILPNVGSGATCGSPIEAWNALTAPSAGRLSSKAVGVPTNADPCLIPPSGGYRGLSVRTLASLVAALIYVLSPVDFLPDFIPGIGLIDDAAVLVFLLHSMAQDLAAFRLWEQTRVNV